MPTTWSTEESALSVFKRHPHGPDARVTVEWCGFGRPVVAKLMPGNPRKPRMTRQQQLASRPVRLVDGEMKDGRLTVKINPARWSSWLLRLPKDATKTFEFDLLGQLVWQHCDGKTSVQQISRKLAKTYNVSEREAQVATEKFLVMLARKGLVGAAVKSDR